MKTNQSNITVLQQLCKLIPQHLLQPIAKEKGIDKKARAFTPMSHLATILFAQLARVASLSDLRDWLQLKELSKGKPTKPDANFIQTLFWEVNNCSQIGICPWCNKSPLHRSNWFTGDRHECA